MAAFVLGPIVVLGLPHEISQWYVAAAMEKWLDGDRPGAFRCLDQALRWRHDAPSIYLQKAQWELDDGQYQAALDDFNRVLAVRPNDTSVAIRRTVALQRLGRHREAIDQWKVLVKRYEDAGAEVPYDLLNGLAYAQALGKTELDEALQNAEKSLASLQRAESSGLLGQPDQANFNRMGAQAALLDTRGYIHLLRGELDAAKRDLDTAVALSEKRLSTLSRSTQYIDAREFQSELATLRQEVAVIRYHRALLSERLGHAEQAARDRRRVRELGCEPNDALF